MTVSNCQTFFSVSGARPELFPFVYQESYAKFLKAGESKVTKIIYDKDFNSLAFKIWKFKFIIAIQPMYAPLDKEGNRLSAAKEEAFTQNFIQHIKRKRIAQRITQAENFAIFQTAPKKTISAPFGTYFLDLEKNSEETLFKNLHAKHRNVIKNAEKKGVEILFGAHLLKDFYQLYEQTTSRSGMYCEPFEHFKNLAESMPDSVICGVAFFNERAQGALFMPYTRFGAFYLHGSSADQIMVNGAINFLHWETIKLMKRKGVKRYDFVGARLSDISGTKLEGIQQFKSRFGAELEKGFLWKKNLDKFDNLIFDIASQSNQILKGQEPVLDIIDEERKKLFHQQSRQSVLKNTLKSNQKKIISKFRIFKRTIKQKDLLKDLSRSGLDPGDTLILHSSLSKIGNIEGGAHAVLNAFIEYLGPKGNLVSPAFSYLGTMQDTIKSKEYIFNPEVNRSIVGIISEEFRKLPGVKRSVHPTHSVCALGPDAAFITEGHFAAATNFGPDTPFHRLRELKGKIVGIGIPIGPVTIYHSVEDFYPELFKGVYVPKQSTLAVEFAGKVQTKKISIHNAAYHRFRIDKTKHIENWFREHLLKKGILHESPFGESVIWWMDIQQLFDEQLRLQKEGITIYKVPGAENKA